MPTLQGHRRKRGQTPAQGHTPTKWYQWDSNRAAWPGSPMGHEPTVPLGVASRGSRGPGRTTPSTAWGHLPFSQLCLGFGNPCPNAPRIRSLSPHPGRLPQATQEGLEKGAGSAPRGGGGTGSTVLRATGSARAKENRKCLSGKISPSPPGSKWDSGSQVPAVEAGPKKREF